ncbi:MAG: FtsX-like permease family protein [Anaerolineales bacterium]
MNPLPFPFALRRIRSHLALALCLTGGMALAAALAVAIPLYADGVNRYLLDAALSSASAKEQTASFGSAQDRPFDAAQDKPFDFIFHYIGSWYEPVTPEQYTPVDAYLQNQFAGMVGLLQESLTRYVSTGRLQLYPAGETINRSQRLELVKLAFVTGIFEHVKLVEGRLPQPKVDNTASLEALAPLTLANEIGLEAGIAYLLYQPGNPPTQLQVLITGLWAPDDPSETFWFYPPGAFDKRLLIPEETFFGPVAQALPLPVDEAVWRLTLDGQAVFGEAVPGLLARIDQAQIQISALLPHTDLETSPVPALRQYRRDSLALTGLLFIFSAPVLGLALYFLGLVAGMFVRRQRNEIAVLRGRGATRRWVTGVYLLEWLLVGGLALALGVGLGVVMARPMGQTHSFLQFNQTTTLSIHLSRSALGAGLGVVGLSLAFSLLPVWQAGRDTIVSHKREQARARRKPLWQRFYLDVMLILPVLYSLYALRGQGSSPVSTWTSSPYEDPLLFLLPTLFILALGLLLLRLLPHLLTILEKAIAFLPGIVPLLAFRQLARAGRSQMGPLMLMVITLALAGFVASMAKTLDQTLADAVYYEIGADLNLVEGGEYTGESATTPTAGGQATSPTVSQPGQNDPALWNFLPVAEHLNLPGVLAAARVGQYAATLDAGGQSASGTLIGVDRADFPDAAFFRDDFASEPLVSLMNRLASDPAALLLDRATWERLHLNTGDPVVVQMALEDPIQISFKAVGVLDYFPTLEPGTETFFIANLETIFEAFGGYLPYDVWLRTSPEANPDEIIQGIHDLRIAVIRAQDARAVLEQKLNAPSRQGMLGLLSIGFLAAALLSIVGFLLHARFSFQERFIQLGVLRALGLSIRQMGLYLALEQCLLVVTGLLAGTGMAVLTAYLFIPQLPTGFTGLGALPSVVAIAWQPIIWIEVAFAGVLLVGIGLTLWGLVQRQVFQAIKLGENL